MQPDLGADGVQVHRAVPGQQRRLLVRSEPGAPRGSGRFGQLTAVCRSRQERAFSRLPHTRMEHQVRDLLRERS